MEPFALPMLPRAYGWPSGKSGEQGSGGDGPPQILRVRAFSWGLMPMQWIWSQSRSQGPLLGAPTPALAPCRICATAQHLKVALDTQMSTRTCLLS